MGDPAQWQSTRLGIIQVLSFVCDKPTSIMRMVYQHHFPPLSALCLDPLIPNAKLTPDRPSNTFSRPEFTFTLDPMSWLSTPTLHSPSFLIDHCWPVHGVLFPFAADTRGRVQFGRVSLDFCISYFHLHSYFPCWMLYCYPLLDMTLDDLHIFAWIWLHRDGKFYFLLISRHYQRTATYFLSD